MIGGSGAVVPDLVRRQIAVAETLKQFRGRPMAWGKRWGNCAALLAYHLQAMGHPAEPVPPLRNLLAARRDLDRRGCETIAGVVDAQGLERIAPAMMLLGDVGYRSSADGLGGVLICAGPRKMIGWFANEETGGRLCVGDFGFDQVEVSWRL